ncbi:MAG TPA: TonB-dependent siderophore receptor [Pyrinomonadaceae bacterium]
MRVRTKKRSRTTKRRAPKYWIVAVGTMSMLVAFCPQNSHAITIRKATLDTEVSTNFQRPLKFSIPADSLEVVMIAFQKASGLQVVIPNDAMRAIPSPGVSGVYTVEQALKQILVGTGLNYRYTDSKTVTLEIQGANETVEVRTDSQIQIASPKYTEPLLDTPQTISVISKETIEEQGATTLRDVLRNVPGLTITAGEGGTPAGDNLTLRGFSARNDIFIDGVRDISPQSRDPFNLEEVDVVKGPGSVYTGRGSTGGSINLLNKTPNLKKTFAGGVDLGTDRTRRFTGDINVPFSDSIAFRLNLLAHHSQVPGREVVNFNRWGVAPSITWGLGKPTRFTASYYKLKQNNLSDYGIPWVPATNNALVAFRDRPAPVPRDTYYGLKNRDHEDLDSDLVTLKFEHDFNDALSLRNQFRFSDSTRDSIASPPRFDNDASSNVHRELRSWQTDDRVWDNQTDFVAQFSTGPISHALVTGLDLTREGNIRHTRTGTNMPTSFLNPNPDDVYTGTIVESPIVGDVTANSQAVYLFDTAKFGKQWEFTGGLRWDRFDASGISTTGVSVARVDRMLSGRAGIVFKPVPAGSFYASYGTSLNPSLEGLSYNTANTVIDPEKTYTFEAGSKWSFFEGRMLFSGAGFRVEKLNARTPGLLPGDPPQVLQGKQRVDGIELSLTGNITRNWQMLAGYTLLDSETVDSNTVTEIGKRLVNTPRNSFNAWSTYRLDNGLSFGGGARFVDKRYGNTINTRIVDAYWTFDAMATYPLNKHIDLQLNLYNLTDKFYFDRLGGGHVVPGPGRAVSLRTSFRF